MLIIIEKIIIYPNIVPKVFKEFNILLDNKEEKFENDNSSVYSISL